MKRSIVFIISSLLLGFVAEEKSRLAAAKNYMVEYLENVCIHRYAKVNHASVVEETEETAQENSEEQNAPEEPEVEIAEAEQEEEKRNDQEMRIRAILEEFLA